MEGWGKMQQTGYACTVKKPRRMLGARGVEIGKTPLKPRVVFESFYGPGGAIFFSQTIFSLKRMAGGGYLFPRHHD